MPSEVQPGHQHDLETELSPPGSTSRGPLEVPAPDDEDDELGTCVSMASRKAASVEAAEMFVSRHYRDRQVELSSIECRQIAALAVEMGGSHAFEMCGSQRHRAEAPKWGLQAGYVVDGCEREQRTDQSREW